MKATITTSIFQKVISAVLTLVEKANFVCTDMGIIIRAVDSAHVGLVDVSLSNCLLKDYECNNKETFGLDLVLLQKLLKWVKGDTIEIETKDNLLNLSFDNADFNLNLIDIQDDMLCVPHITTNIEMKFLELHDIIQMLEMFSDVVKISKDKSKLEFSAMGENGQGSVCADVIDIKTKIKVQHSFSLKYLKLFCKNYLSECVQLNFENGAPLMVKYDLSKPKGRGCTNAATENSYVRFYVAAKID